MINMLQIVIFKTLQILGEATKLVAAGLDRTSTIIRRKVVHAKLFLAFAFAEWGEITQQRSKPLDLTFHEILIGS